AFRASPGRDAYEPRRYRRRHASRVASEAARSAHRCALARRPRPGRASLEALAPRPHAPPPRSHASGSAGAAMLLHARHRNRSGRYLMTSGAPASTVSTSANLAKRNERAGEGAGAVTHAAGNWTLRSSGAEYLVHRFALGEFIDQFIEVADVLHQGLLDLLHAHPADDAGDQRALWIGLRRLLEKISETGFLLQVRFQRRLAISRQPADNFVDLRFCAALLLGLGDVLRINRSEAHGVDALPVRDRACAIGGVHRSGRRRLH